MDIVNNAYDRIERIAKLTMKEEFGFGSQRIARFEEKFSELSVKECELIQAELRKKQRR